jgi:restriction endonuclease Mrr
LGKLFHASILALLLCISQVPVSRLSVELPDSAVGRPEIQKFAGALMGQKSKYNEL